MSSIRKAKKRLKRKIAELRNSDEVISITSFNYATGCWEEYSNPLVIPYQIDQLKQELQQLKRKKR